VNLTQQDLDNLTEIQRLLDEGLKHYLTYESHCKSSEGSVTVEWDFGNSWERFEGPVTPKLSCSVYSYALGPERSHYFDSIEEALEEVRKWHKAEMEFTPDEDYGEQMDAIAKDFIEAMGDRLTIVQIDRYGNEVS
jgi:hypothetical protein